MSSGRKTLVARPAQESWERRTLELELVNLVKVKSRYSLDPVADDTKASKSQRDQTPTTK
ncbi:hypothetical protein J6590_077793 [Homalodisca vitripennis]|nr:hypothetical protein J6590_077793 [Homalodisca vitripennis]